MDTLTWSLRRRWAVAVVLAVTLLGCDAQLSPREPSVGPTEFAEQGTEEQPGRPVTSP